MNGNVSIAFRRSATWLLYENAYKKLVAELVSIAFRRSATWLQIVSLIVSVLVVVRSPLPFGVLPPGYRSLRRVNMRMLSGSPLPFGVLPPGYTKKASTALPLWVKSPLPFGVLPPGYYWLLWVKKQ